MKIVDVSEFYAEQGGGVRTYTLQKLAAARRLGHDLTILAPGPEDREDSLHGGRIRWLKSPRMPFDARYHVFVSPSAVRQALTRAQPDVIEGSSVWSGGWFASLGPTRAFKALLFHQDPVAVYAHTWLDRALAPSRIDGLFLPYWRSLRRLSQRYDVTVTAAPWLAQRLAARGLHNPRAVDFGCDVSRFSPERADPTLRAALLAQTQTPPEGVLLACISRHHPEKRLHTLCEALAKLRVRLPIGLVVFGDGPLRSQVARWARRAGGVYLAGFTRDRDELARALASADALLHGSAAETYGIAIAEALSSGLPVVVPERGGAAELAHADCSELYVAGDSDACAAAIERLLARPRAELREAARRRAACAIRDLDSHFDALFALYEDARQLRINSSKRADGARVD